MGDTFLLPASTYQAPARLARKHTLNTIIEDKRGEKEEQFRGRSESLEPPRSHSSASPVPSLTSSISSYYQSSHRESSDFDDLYDVSDDDDSEIALSVMSNSRSPRAISPSGSPPNKMTNNRCPSLIIPSPRFWPTIEKANSASPPRPPKIPLSPAALSVLGQDLGGPSNPPSLANSLFSDPPAGVSAPVTPDMQTHSGSGDFWGQTMEKASQGKVIRPVIRVRTDATAVSNPNSILYPEDHVSVRDFARPAEHHRSDSPVLGSDDGHSESGVELPADALRMLQHLSLEVSATADTDFDGGASAEMEEAHEAARRSSGDWTPASQTSEYSISQISIPSPSDFFSSLAGNARHTWTANSAPASALPPSSTTAENFYNCPWNKSPRAPIEQIVEVSDNDTDGPPTARQLPPLPQSVTPTRVCFNTSPRIGADEAMDIHEEDYEQAIQETAEKSLDRTSTWLAAQTSYMAALRETNPINDLSVEAEITLQTMSSHERNDSIGSPMRKAVKFLESEISQRESCQEGLQPKTSLYYQAFQHIMADSKRSDAFRHRHARSDSTQSIRMCLPYEHVNRLQGEFHISPIERPSAHRPISMWPGREQDQPEQTSEQKVIARVEKERQALEQVDSRAWVIEASKFLNGGSLIRSPARNLVRKSPSRDEIVQKVKPSARVLDLAGQPHGDWAWHCAREFPHARIYTATTDRHLVDSRISGPRNHKCHAVAKLWELPYLDNYFQVISTRSLFAYLKNEKPIGEAINEYDLCLKECLRCLKPGGYLEFFNLDSEILNAGSRGTAVSVEFGFNLKTRGYDPCPTKSFLGRLRKAGFDDIKRAWTILPMGTPSAENRAVPETPSPNVSNFAGDNLEAVQGPIGSTADAASMTGLVGSWAWEQWMLKLEMEMGKKNLLEGVGAVLEEGKATGAGWRCLSGWARKPLQLSGREGQENSN